MHLLSLDIETTGLDASTDQILEVGCIAVDFGKPHRKLTQFRRLVKHERYQGNAIALSMNAAILREIDEAEKRRAKIEDQIARSGAPGATTEELKATLDLDPTAEIVTLEELVSIFSAWVKGLPGYETTEKFTLTGKNVGSFDLAFMRMAPGWYEAHKVIKTGHRCMDPGPIFASMAFDIQPPDLKECRKRAGIEAQTEHRAIADAAAVIEALASRSRLATHLKTGKLYEVVMLNYIINATNDQDGQRMVLYRNEKNEFFVREFAEFEQKFSWV